MVFWIASVAMVAGAYLLGATPTGYLAGRWLRGVDVRAQGSGSTGATNVLRTLGPGPAAAVLAADLAKGAAAVLLARAVSTWLFAVAPPAGLTAETWTPWAVCLAGLAAVVGHSRPVWLGFTGGKSAAAGLGVLLAMAWPAGLGAAAVFLAVVAAFRIVSLGSMLAALAAVALVWGLDQPLAYRLLAAAGALYVIARHRANLGRLLAGTEPRLAARG